MSQQGVNMSLTDPIWRERLATAIVDRQWQRYSELEARYGREGHAKCVQDVKYNLSFLAEAINATSPTLFNNYIAWVKVLFAGLNIPVEDLAANLELMAELLQEELPPEISTIAADYISQSLQRLHTAPDSLPTFIEPDQPLGVLAQQYLEALLRAERPTASRLILESVEQGLNVREVYLHVFQPVQREIGRLWQINRLSVAQEHYCTAATQLIMSQLYPYIFDSAKNDRRLVATCVGNELHEIGIRMVADFFEMEGWDTYYLGANVPQQSIIRTVTEQKADVLALSATMTFHISQLQALIARLRDIDIDKKTKVMVGGYPFNTAPDLWQRVGADAYAPDAQTALVIADQLLAKEN